jgi:hypothetical protein
MEKNIEFIIGLILFIYGIVKITIGIVGALLPTDIQNKLKHIEIFKYIIDDDDTLAGKLFLYCLMLFGLYSILHSLHVLNILSHDIKKYVNKHTLLIINLFIGFVLTIYYYLVLYTDIKLDSNDKYRSTYITHGLFTGIFFLVMIPLTNIYYNLKKIGMSAFSKFPVYMITNTIVSYGLLYFMVKLWDQVYDIKFFNLNFIMLLFPFHDLL